MEELAKIVNSDLDLFQLEIKIGKCVCVCGTEWGNDNRKMPINHLID